MKAKSTRFLTKSRYKLALECPTKLFYTKKKDLYEDQSIDNDFLKAIAKGGFQVGALAKCYFPSGVEVKTLDYEDALKQTNELLPKENVTIFEPAFHFENLFVRVDIFDKKKNQVKLIEVKSKSAEFEGFFDEIRNRTSKNQFKLKSDWKPYLYDLAFQTHVVRKFRPDWQVTPYLMLADTSKTATVDGLNQKFLLKEVDGRTTVEIVGDVSPAALGENILFEVNLTEVIDKIINDQEFSGQIDGLGFRTGISVYSKNYSQDIKISPRPIAECKSCEFRSDTDLRKSGFFECWSELKIIDNKTKDGPFCFDIWHSPKLKDLLDNEKYLMRDVSAEDIAPQKISDKGEKLSRFDRQSMQIEMTNSKAVEPYINIPALKREMDNWKPPFHFIDFETCRVAIPFNKGRRPYEQIAFQFSHHQVDADGRIWHRGEFLEASPGKFPNFNFVRALKEELGGDDGTIFRYSHHENTVLCEIHDQLSRSAEPDRQDLMAFIETITKKKEGSGKSERILWEGDRLMVDLCQVAEWYYMSPLSLKSLSLKYVLPAILNESEFLKTKYSKAIYGTHWGIPSRNFKEKRWIEIDGSGLVIDPYKQLPTVFNDIDREKLDLLTGEDDLRNGGAAMTAYAMMQFSLMTPEERGRLRSALLKYCELDTLAMVMLWEYWRDLLAAVPVAKLA